MGVLVFHSSFSDHSHTQFSRELYLKELSPAGVQVHSLWLNGAHLFKADSYKAFCKTYLGIKTTFMDMRELER